MIGKWISPLRPVTRYLYGVAETGKLAPALSMPSQYTVWTPEAARPVMTRLVVVPGSKSTPSRLMTIWKDTVLVVENWKVPPAPTVEVLPPWLPTKLTAVSVGVGGTVGMPRAPRTRFTSTWLAPAGVMSMKKIGSCGRCETMPSVKDRPVLTNWLLPRMSL